MPRGDLGRTIIGIINFWIQVRYYANDDSRVATAAVVGVFIVLPVVMAAPMTTVGILMVGGAAYLLNNNNTRQSQSRGVEMEPYQQPRDYSSGFDGFYSPPPDDLPPRPYRDPHSKSSSNRRSRKGGHGGGDTVILREIGPDEVIPTKGEFISASTIDDVITKVLMRYGISSDDIDELLELAKKHKNFDSLQKDDAYHKLILKISKDKNLKNPKLKQSNNTTRRSSTTSLLRSIVIDP